MAGPTVIQRGDSHSTHRSHIVLLGILAVFIALSSFVALKTPPGLSNDELSHIQNVETLVAGHLYGMHLGHPELLQVFGKTINAGQNSGFEAHQPPLYYLILAGWQRLTGVPPQTPQRGFLVAPDNLLILLRIPNVLMGAMTVWLTYMAARIIAKDVWTPVVAAAIIGFLPRFVFLSAFVTNDNLSNLFGALLTFFALRFVVSPTRWRMALVGATVGLLIVTKLSALPFAVILIVLAFRRREWLERAKLIAIGCVSSVVVCGWYLIQNTIRYGGPLAAAASQRYLTQIGGGLGMPYGVPYRVTDPLKTVVLDVPTRFIHAFFYGWGQDDAFFKPLPLPVSLLFWVLLASALVGLIGRHVSRMMLVVLGTLTLAGFLSVWMVAFQTASYDPRLALVGMPALACLAALGLERWKLTVRFLTPLLGLGGTLFAIQANSVWFHWT